VLLLGYINQSLPSPLVGSPFVSGYGFLAYRLVFLYQLHLLPLSVLSRMVAALEQWPPAKEATLATKAVLANPTSLVGRRDCVLKCRPMGDEELYVRVA